MGLGKKTIDDQNYCGKKVLVRCDFNVPMKDGVITNENRINAALPTIQKLVNDGAKVILCSHLGKPKNGPEAKFSLAPVAVALSAKLGKTVVFADDDNVVGENAKAAVAAMNNGDVVLLQNTRFRKEETKNMPEFSEELASLADAYVDDAFGSCHRAHCSTAGVTDFIKDTAVGYLMEKEIKYLGNAVNDPERPFTAILGGAKVSDAFQMMETVLSRGVADEILTGGLVANIFLIARGQAIGSGSYDFIAASNYTEYFDKAKALYAAYGDRIVLPVDLAWVRDGRREEAKIDRIPEEIGAVDVGAETASLYCERILRAKTAFVNGPMGVFEKPESELGTQVVWQALADTTAFTVLGGGDSITATEKYGLTEKMGYICTGGGALIRFLSGEELPVVNALRHGSTLPQ